jgi:hypothetical protein
MNVSVYLSTPQLKKGTSFIVFVVLSYHFASYIPTRATRAPGSVESAPEWSATILVEDEVVELGLRQPLRKRHTTFSVRTVRLVEGS